MGDVVDLKLYRETRAAAESTAELPCDAEPAPEWLTEFFASTFDPMTPADGNET